MATISNSIGGDNYGDIVQAGRDAHVTKHAGAALDAARELRAALGRIDLPPAARGEALGALVEIEDELRGPAPDRRAVADRLERVTAVPRRAGALLGAGVALATPIGTIASWLGPLGAALR